MVVIQAVVLIIVHPHDLAEVHHLVVDDSPVDDEVDDEDEDDGNK